MKKAITVYITVIFRVFERKDGDIIKLAPYKSQKFWLTRWHKDEHLAELSINTKSINDLEMILIFWDH